MDFVEYYTEVEGINPSTLKVNYTDNYVNGIDIKINFDKEIDLKKYKMVILFILNKNIISVDDTLKSTLETAKDIINLLTFKTGGKFGIPRRGHFNINGHGIVSIGKLTLYNPKNKDLPQGLSNTLELDLRNNNLLSDLKNNDYHRLYRAAMQTDDIITRYMFLYGIIYHIKNSSQNLVDAYVRSINPNIEERTSTNPRTLGKQITKYTWLRNEIGHTTAATDIKNVEKEITDVCDTFAELVKGVI
ncbi:methylamine utilization protein MauJ [Ectobacillus sp. sgz5001026]|uniref:methylamine utilization protein MauJ n=1 Tax=Ectobacillus sp. sgz5001026 TaxID=3242473 RepID=UPI0036D34D22